MIVKKQNMNTIYENFDFMASKKIAFDFYPASSTSKKNKGNERN